MSRNRVFLQKIVIKNFDISRTSVAVAALFRRAFPGKRNGWQQSWSDMNGHLLTIGSAVFACYGDDLALKGSGSGD